MEFRIARSARDHYGFEDNLFSIDGDVIVIDTERAHNLAERFASDPSARAKAASEISAIGLIHELGHRAVAIERQADPDGGGPMARALLNADGKVGIDSVDGSLMAFEGAFPAAAVYREEATVVEFVRRARGGVPGREAALEELVLTWIGRENPAAAAYRELIDDPMLSADPQRQLVRTLGADDLTAAEPDAAASAPARRLIERLREPIVAAPQSLGAQLRWIRAHWAGWLDDADLLHIDRQLSVIEELDRAVWLRAQREPDPGDHADAAALAGFAGLDDEPEGFSEDRRWMAELVLLAKSTYVWLSQLSRKYDRDISTLDQIPDEELAELAEHGFTGLWLIGIWERSSASQRIKQMRGNPEAMASAYSVADYRIADELGGDDAWGDLRERATARGIRLAADMVPNHMGLDSTWVVEHPERFIWSPYPPFESYSFSGDDVSADERVAIQIEDHYWDSSDAAVVFKRTDRASGEERYIYHGNDGTSFPWNDTAQLDYLRADVREAVIGQILEVARRFDVIRFDAAMVLARRHIQRLWYPLPGHEGGIPSRSAAAIPAAELRRLMPAEFWREVVDRVAVEVPHTLLLAEAFWLMEGYFVRSLGMHRVYNSAFMHMLRDEQNADYQQVIRETVTFDARILGRYVNFMSNPDERSAVDQFGSHDKYFGVTTLLATLPGLPMFGHGQIEGYSEQYGMEFRRPQRDEPPDEGLIDRHRRQIFPLLRQRWRFAGSTGFTQLTAFDGDLEVADVFAYCNRAETGPAEARERRSLVVYLNRLSRAHVRIVGVAAALDLSADEAGYLILTDQHGLDHLCSVRDIRGGGLEMSLDGYACLVFLDFEQVHDADGSWGQLAERIGLGAVPDAHLERRRMQDEPLRAAVASLFATRVAEEAFLPGATVAPDTHPGADAGRAELAAAVDRVARAADYGDTTVSTAHDAAHFARLTPSLRPRLVAQATAAWAIFQIVGEVACDGDATRITQAFDEWDAAEVVAELARRSGSGDGQAERVVELARALLAIEPGALASAASADGLPLAWFESEAVRTAVGWNEWQGATYLSQEAWDELIGTLAERDGLLEVESAGPAAAELRRRAAAQRYRLDVQETDMGGGAAPG
ncbi:MAG: alpha-amylase family glycosyl hydrolase [Chloroflexota bacterium]